MHHPGQKLKYSLRSSSLGTCELGRSHNLEESSLGASDAHLLS